MTGSTSIDDAGAVEIGTAAVSQVAAAHSTGRVVGPVTGAGSAVAAVAPTGNAAGAGASTGSASGDDVGAAGAGTATGSTLSDDIGAIETDTRAVTAQQATAHVAGCAAGAGSAVAGV